MTSEYHFTLAKDASFLSVLALATAVAVHNIPDQDPGDALIRHYIRQDCIQSHISAEFAKCNSGNISLSAKEARSCVDSNYAHYVENVKNSRLHQILDNGLVILLALFSLGSAARAAAAYRLGTAMEKRVSDPDSSPQIP